MKTLLLNSCLEPISLIPWQKAITMYFLDKIEIISNKSLTVSSQKITINIPDVVELKEYHFFRNKPKLNKVNILIRDKFQCQYCLKSLTLKTATLDHLKPKSKGGKRSWDNIVSCCKKCNIKKSDKSLKESNMKLNRKPKKVNILQFYIQNCPEKWKKYF